jgi:hypothetical protein
MKKMLFVAAMLFLFSVPNVYAQKEKKEISHYMREIGLLYLENVESYHYNPAADDSDINERAYARTMDGIEERVKINITSEADKQYLELLTMARLTHEEQQMHMFNEIMLSAYQRQCFKGDGKPKRTNDPICHHAPILSDERLKIGAAWYPYCNVEAKRVYTTGEISGITCKIENMRVFPPVEAAVSSMPK